MDKSSPGLPDRLQLTPSQIRVPPVRTLNADHVSQISVQFRFYPELNLIQARMT